MEENLELIFIENEACLMEILTINTAKTFCQQFHHVTGNNPL